MDFVADHDLSFRRPPHAHSSGRPRSNMAETFNLPIRSPYVQTFSTDGRGFRNAIDLTRADIALVGDSYIEGAYVSDEETAAVRLQEQLGQPVANLGVSGYGSLQELKVLEKYAVPLGPKMVAWFFFEGNDLDDDQIVRERDGLRTRRPRTARHARVRVPAVARIASIDRSRSTRSRCSGSGRTGWCPTASTASAGSAIATAPHTACTSTTSTPRARSAPTSSSVSKRPCAAFRQGAEICRQHGIRLVAVYIPIKFRVYGDLCTYPAGSPLRRMEALGPGGAVRRVLPGSRHRVPLADGADASRRRGRPGALRSGRQPLECGGPPVRRGANSTDW